MFKLDFIAVNFDSWMDSINKQNKQCLLTNVFNEGLLL